MKNFQKLVKRVIPRRLKICLAIPCTGTVRVETMLTVIGILNATPCDFYTAYNTSCYVHVNRHSLATRAIQENCDKLFFLDADMVVEHQVVNKLLALDKPFVGANYNKRKLPLVSNVKFADENGKIVARDSLPAEPFQCYGVPTGCMLIDIPSLKKLPQPWFDVTLKEDGSLDYGEDIDFCRRVNENGFEVWCDPTIDIGHIGTYVY